jgi:hypothetical protein
MYLLRWLYGQNGDEGGLMNETVKTNTTKLKEEVQELAIEAKESVSGVLQAFVLALCAGFLILMLGMLLLVVAVI